MSVKITYFVHGTTTDNEKEISSGWSDVELSELGIEQSKKLREQSKDQKFDVVFCSDLKRAVHSAELAFGGNFPIIKDKRLRECNYGKLNASLSSIVVPMCKGECLTNKFPDGESYEDVKVRIADFLEFLKKNYEGKHIAIVSHMAPQLSLDVLLKGKTWELAHRDDWRNTKSWQPGWDYQLTQIEP
jgi:broad specificity phosphatase PhoE